MDFKKLAAFIAFFGMVTLIYGGYQWGTNQPKTYEQRAGMFGLPDFASSGNNWIENGHREMIRDGAVKIMIAGGIVLFIGMAISASAKPSSNVLPSPPPPTPSAAFGNASRGQQVVIVLGVIALIVVVWFVMSGLPSKPLPSPNMDKSYLR